LIIKRPVTVVNRQPEVESYLAVATFVPIARWRDVMKASKLSSQVESQLKQSAGVVAYSLAVNPLRRHFWTCSIWRDDAAIASFTRMQPHATAVERFKDWAGVGAAFARWQTPSPILDWDEAFRRLEQPSFYYEKPA
jgi:hypothetical protein